MEKMHEGHRARLKQRFLKEDLDHFESHQILELMLFYVIPKQDTNPLAHRLLERFGTLSGVLEAPIEELIKVDGIKENAATYLKMFPSVCRMYEQSCNRRCDCYDTLEKIVEFAKAKFVGVSKEQVYVLLFNNRLQMDECFFVAEGTVNGAAVLPRVIIERVFLRGSSSIVLMHNHPNGDAMPSADDIQLTAQLREICKCLNIHFLDHLIIAGDQYTSMMRKYSVKKRLSPLTGTPDPTFYRSFYAEPDKEGKV